MRHGLKLLAAVAALLLLLFAAFCLLRGVTRFTLSGATLGGSEPDPMFAEPEVRVTRPPEDDGDGAPVVSADEDPSRDWVYETLTPVEQTAAELAEQP